MAATMTFVVEYVWSGKKPGIFKRKFYESEFARVNNWLKRRTASEPTEVSKLKELIQAYALVNNDLRIRYKCHGGTYRYDSRRRRSCQLSAWQNCIRLRQGTKRVL